MKKYVIKPNTKVKYWKNEQERNLFTGEVVTTEGEKIIKNPVTKLEHELISETATNFSFYAQDERITGFTVLKDEVEVVEEGEKNNKSYITVQQYRDFRMKG